MIFQFLIILINNYQLDHSDCVVESVRKRPGPDAFLEALANVGKSQSYASAAGNACPSADQEELCIFHAFTGIYRKHEAAISRHVAQFEDVRAEIAEKRENIEKIRAVVIFFFHFFGKSCISHENMSFGNRN